MKRLAVVILLLSGVAWGQAPAPITIKAKAGKQAVLTFKATGEVAWVWDRRYLPDDQTYQDKAQKSLVVTSGNAATFLVTAVEHQPTKGFTQTEYLVTFEGGPVPPPGPDPPLPPPPDTLESRMLKAYLLDKAAGKAKESELRLTAEIFKAADQVFGVITSTGMLYQVLDLGLSTAASSGIPQMKVVIDAHLAKIAPRGKDVPLTDALKDSLKTASLELAKAVEACLAPQPPPQPVIGPRMIIIIRETANSTPELRQAIIALRAGPHAKSLLDKGHTLAVLDDDAVGPDGKPAVVLEKWRPQFKDLRLPVLVVADAQGAVIIREALPDNVTAEQVMEIVRKAGG